MQSEKSSEKYDSYLTSATDSIDLFSPTSNQKITEDDIMQIQSLANSLTKDVPYDNL
jgi:hypothetical protein